MTDSFFGQMGLSDTTSPFNSLTFHIRQELGQVRTGIPVKIIAVHGGGVGPAPTVDVQPVINQIDGQGNQTPHSTIFGVPVIRSQGGTGAVIMDPKEGDVGHMVVSDRDISSLKSSQGAQSNPGSFRRHDLADGVYHGAALNGGTPTRYILMNGPGIQWVDEFGNKAVSNADGWTLTDKNGNIITMKAGVLSVDPAGGMVFLGGSGTDGAYDFVQTVSGPSINVKAKFG
jgi:hypothetical protein